MAQPHGNAIPSPDERQRAQQALDLRLGGATWARIAERLLYADESGARHAANALLDRTDYALADQYRDMEGARLERLLLAVWADAVRGDLQAVEAARRLIESRVKLYGLALPTKVEVSSVVTHEEWAATAAALMAEIGAAEPPLEPRPAIAADDAEDWTAALGG